MVVCVCEPGTAERFIDHMSLKVCIVGCGAIGSIFAAHLSQLGDVEVYVFDTSEEHIRAILGNGLRVSGPAVEFIARPHATCDPQDIPRCDFGILATKSGHTRNAIERTSDVFSDSGIVCSVQNGLGNEEIIAEYVSHVIRGATTMAAHLVAPGCVGFEFNSDIWLGPFEPANTTFASVEQLAALLNRSGLRAVALPDARGAQWTKLIFNSAVNPVGALTLLDHGAAARLPATAALYESLLREGEAVAKALGIQLHGDARQMIAEGANSSEKRNVSMLLDVLSHRPTEVDFLNGAVADWGEKLGVPVPLNRALWQLIRGLEHSWGRRE
jgi:2-dehydropantoate 2-reductase